MTVLEMRRCPKSLQEGTKEWFLKRVDEILNSDPICTASERNLIKCAIGGEVFTLDQCWENFHYLTDCDLYKQLSYTLSAKNADYSGGDDAFSNLRLCETIGISAEDGIKVRMCDKVSRIRNLMSKNPEVVEETLADTWLDLAGYLVLDYLYDEYLIALDAKEDAEEGQRPDPQNEN